MKLIKRTFLVGFILFYGVHAKTILITDIDDTIKVGHIRSNIGKVANAFRTNNIFLGMAPLYHMIKNDSNSEIFYLSNAPEFLMKKSHEKLIENGQFPDGNLVLRPSGVSSDEHKEIALVRIIDEHKPDNVILIGDNGEHDVKFYDDVTKKYSGINFYTYIRIAYDLDPVSEANPVNEQIGFVSPFEIGDNLLDSNLISKKSMNSLYENFGQDFIKSTRSRNTGQMFWPKWQSCKGHISDLQHSDVHPITIEVQDKIEDYCR